MTEEQKALIVAQIETAEVSPRSIEVVPEQMKVPGADGTMFVCYGKDAHDRKVWVATFVDSDEAMGWVHGNKMFGRPVTGAVMAGEVKKEPEGPKLVDESGAAISDAPKPN
jgi:hypothetical protein